MRIPLTWVLVADGATAHIFRTTGKSGAHRALLQPVPGGVFHRSDPAHFGPRPGKNFSSALRNSGHGVTTHENLKRHAEEEFVAVVLGWIEKPENLAAFENLIIVAPSRALGEIRSAMSQALLGRTHHEIHGDLTKLPVKELEERLLASLAGIAAEHRYSP
ncbi:MAG: host attachment protein [Beijerinckiaceae bacterium]